MESQERSEAYGVSDRNERAPLQVKEKPVAKKNPTASALLSSSNDGKIRHKTCELCRKWHCTEKCFSLHDLSLPDRYTKIRKAGLCLKCLGKGHFARECEAKCKGCGKGHHEVLCEGSQSKEIPQESVSLANSQSDANQTTYFQVAEVVCSSSGTRRANFFLTQALTILM